MRKNATAISLFDCGAAASAGAAATQLEATSRQTAKDFHFIRIQDYSDDAGWRPASLQTNAAEDQYPTV